MSEDAFERLARRCASGEITHEAYGRQLDRLIALEERVRFLREAVRRERQVRRGVYERLSRDMRRLDEG